MTCFAHNFAGYLSPFWLHLASNDRISSLCVCVQVSMSNKTLNRMIDCAGQLCHPGGAALQHHHVSP